MEKFVVNGGKPLFGEVNISGAKNAVVAILPAALLVSGPCRIENVPDISDVRILLDILSGMGARIVHPEPGVVEIDLNFVPNESASSYARNNYTLEAMAVFNQDDILSLKAEGAQSNLWRYAL